MTNRQIAAKLVAMGLADIKQQIKNYLINDIASVGGKQRISQATADKVRMAAVRFIDPWVKRMEKVAKTSNGESSELVQDLGLEGGGW